MKKAGWIATVAAGVVLVGGGAWAATTLPASDDGEVAAIEETPTPTVEPSVTPTPEETATPTPTPEEVLSESDQIFLDWARPNIAVHADAAPELANMSDDEMLATLAAACEAVASHESGDPFVEVVPGMPETDERGNILDESPEAYAVSNINLVFVSAANEGYGPAGARESYCD